MTLAPELTVNNTPSRDSTVEPKTPPRDLDNDKRFQRLNYLVKQSKIYANVLTSRLAGGGDEQGEKDVERSPKRRRTKRNVEVSKYKQSKLVSGVKLHNYQLAGVEWLVSLYENGLNGILADEMGLGKTLQTIGFLAYLIENGIKGPFLIVGPLSTVQNWVNELERFAPKISAVKYHGDANARKKLRRTMFQKSIIITSYEMILRDAEYLRKPSWSYVVVDEGHRLKNMNSKLIKTLKKFDSANRLLLTGTPLQNNLAELWSLLNFLLPDIFTDLDMFQAWFDEMTANSADGNNGANGGGINFGDENNSQLISSLHDILRPFLLRRLKKDVEQDLPDKREYVIYTGLTNEQTELYKSFLNKNAKEYIINRILESRGEKRLSAKDSKPQLMRRDRRQQRALKRHHVDYREIDDDEYFDHLEKIADDDEDDKLVVDSKNMHTESTAETELLIKQASREAVGKSFQNMVMQLRLTCNSPYLFYYPWKSDEPIDHRIVDCSCKMQLLDRLCTKLASKGHKMLIFSQFSKMLDILQDWLEYKAWDVCRIDGSVSQQERQDEIELFGSSKKHKVFLLSTRAGGLGINLTAADSVIIFDSDWNPQMDLQAIDRVHRIGQTKPVVVYRMATGNTVEAKMLARAASKRHLEHVVIERGRFKGLFGDKGLTEQQAIDTLEREIVQSDGPSAGEVSDKDLDVMVDRSPRAYDQARKGTEGLSSNIETVIA